MPAWNVNERCKWTSHGLVTKLQDVDETGMTCKLFGGVWTIIVGSTASMLLDTVLRNYRAFDGVGCDLVPVGDDSAYKFNDTI